LEALAGPLQTLSDGIGGYRSALASYETRMVDVEQRMQDTVAKIQVQEDSIKAQIAAINAKIEGLRQQIQTAREAIAKAKEKRTEGIVETIFGVIAAPFTGGLSLVIAGIGVSSIVEAESVINQLEGDIRNQQTAIVQDQRQMSKDQVEISGLQALVMSADLILHDIAFLDTSLDTLRTGWGVVAGELQGTITKVKDAEDSDIGVVVQAWFNGAVKEMAIVVKGVEGMGGQNPPVTNRVRIG
jgi:DNA repair exonuclease SbcCD ATPase subunit